MKTKEQIQRRLVQARQEQQRARAQGPGFAQWVRDWGMWVEILEWVLK